MNYEHAKARHYLGILEALKTGLLHEGIQGACFYLSCCHKNSLVAYVYPKADFLGVLRPSERLFRPES